jgi:multiple sugar transport system substrate-binding protein
MSGKNDTTSMSRRRFLGTAAAGLAGVTLAACGSSGGGAAQPAAGVEAPAAGGAASGPLSGAALKWSTWGNPGEQQRFREYTDDFNKRTGAKAELVPIPSDYEPKILTQLSGGTAPDAFYSGDTTLSKLISSKSIVELTDLMKGSASKSKPEDFFEGLWGPARTPDGKIWGAPVDCNPMVFWYNKKVLTDAGVTTMPADLAKENKWTWDAFSTMIKQVVDKGKRGFIQENWFGSIFGWITTNGGKVWDGEKFVGHEDPKAVEGFKFIQDNLNAKTFTYSGSLPKGQGMDAMFLSEQTAFITAGRWLLPVFKKAANLQFDIVTWPTNTGKQNEPVPIPTAYMVQNAKTANPEATFAFLTDFVSKEGQTFRLQGGGNAIPAIKGADNVVSEGNLPANWQALIDAREVGTAIWPAQANTPGLSDDIFKALDEVWLKGGDMTATLQKVADIVKAKKGQ